MENNLFKLIKDSTVSVSLQEHYSNKKPCFQVGTAFSINEKHLLTAAHIVSDRKKESIIKIKKPKNIEGFAKREIKGK